MAIQLETVIEAPIEQVFDVASNYRYTEKNESY